MVCPQHLVHIPLTLELPAGDEHIFEVRPAGMRWRGPNKGPPPLCAALVFGPSGVYSFETPPFVCHLGLSPLDLPRFRFAPL